MAPENEVGVFLGIGFCWNGISEAIPTDGPSGPDSDTWQDTVQPT